MGAKKYHLLAPGGPTFVDLILTLPTLKAGALKLHQIIIVFWAKFCVPFGMQNFFKEVANLDLPNLIVDLSQK